MHAVMDCPFLLFQFICLSPAREKHNIAQKYNICKWLSTLSSTLQTITQPETLTLRLLFILQPIYLHNLCLHTSSQPITSRVYQRLLYRLTNQIAHQGFWIFNWLKLPLDSEDGFRRGCQNVSRQEQTFSGLSQPDDHFQSSCVTPGFKPFSYEVLSTWREAGSSKCRWLRVVFRWPYAYNFHTHMVRILCSGKLRMRKQNAKTTVPLDVVPERRTKRFPPRFRPVGRFCEPRFRYLSSPTGREGEISRPLDHMRHIPLIHSARLIDGTNFYIYTTAFQLCLPNGTGKCDLVWRVWQLHMRFPQKYLSQGLEPLLTSFWLALRYELLRIGTRCIQFTHAHFFNKKNRLFFHAYI